MYIGLRDNSEKEGEEMKITVYSTPSCPFCRMVKQHLDINGIHYNEVDMSENPEIARDITTRSGCKTAPITEIDDEFVIGFDRDKIDRLTGVK